MLRKYSISILLILTMVLSMIPFYVHAHENDVEESNHTEPATEENLDAIAEMVEVCKKEGDELSLDAVDDEEYQGFIYKLNDDVSARELKDMESGIADLDDGQSVREITEDELYCADSLETVNEVVTSDMLDYIEPNYIRRLCAYSPTPNDTYYSQQWALDAVNINNVWKDNFWGSSSVKVAVVDTGVNAKHPDLKNITAGISYHYRRQSHESDDHNGHGTFISGIIGAENNNGIGISGLMPGVKIIPVRVFDEGGGLASVADVAKGVIYAADKGADVINMSYGDEYYSRTEEEAVKYALSKNALLIAAVGNESSKQALYPAAYNGVIGVGAVNTNLTHARFSNYNKTVDVVAPGCIILSTTNNKSYAYESGTSFSTAHVSALAAMVKSIDKSIDSAKFTEILAKPSVDKGAAGYDTYYGWGLIDFSSAYEYATETAHGKHTAHVYEAWQLSTRATPSKDGVMTRSCKICGKKERKAIPRIRKAYLSKTKYKYNGKDCKPKVSKVVDRKGNVVPKSSYTVKYAKANSRKRGKYKVKIVFKGSYKGTLTKTYKIK